MHASCTLRAHWAGIWYNRGMRRAEKDKMRKTNMLGRALAKSARAAAPSPPPADSSDEFALLDEIVRTVPGEVTAFFDMFKEARARMALVPEISVLNAVARGEYSAAKDAGHATCLMRWFEVFRDIYIASCIRSERDSHEPCKNPNAFTTFARTFEPLAFLPDFWFANDSLVKGRGVRDLSHPVRLAFERYLYSGGGGRAWGAMDWEMHRYVQVRMCEQPRRNAGERLRRIAALALTLRGILAGELGLYIDERDDVALPLTGLSNSANQVPPLLKYYHYDRFTQLSFTREHEFAKDHNAAGNHMAFEERWLGLAVLSDFILKAANAHSTLAAASRAARNSFLMCMSRIADALGSSNASVIKATSGLETLFESSPRAPDVEAVLSCAGVSQPVARADHYLVAAGLCTAEDFWRRTLPIFRELHVRFASCHESVVATYTQKQMKKGLVRAPDAQERYLSEVFNFGDGNEIPMVLDPPILRNVLRKCLAGGNFELQYGVAARVLLDSRPFRGKVPILSFLTGGSKDIPPGALFGPGEAREFGAWILDVWSRLAAGGGEAPRDYTKLDLANVVRCADRLWNFYFSNERVCMDRWVLSLHVAIAKFRGMRERNESKFDVKAGGGTFMTRVWSPAEIDGMIGALERERDALRRAKVWDDDVNGLEMRVKAAGGTTLATLGVKGDERIFVIYAILARLMVATARTHPELWGNRNELFSLISHILCAAMPHPKVPFPWHIGVFNDSYLRLGRTHRCQRNVVDLVVDHLYDYVERQVLLTFLAHYLSGSDSPQGVLDAIVANESMCGFFGATRIRFLKSYYTREGR